MAGFQYQDIKKYNFFYMHKLLDDIDAGNPIKLANGDTVVFFKFGHIDKLKKFVRRQEDINIRRFLDDNEHDVFIDTASKTGFLFTEIEKSVYSTQSKLAKGSWDTDVMSHSAICIVLASLVHTGGFNLDEQFTIQRVNRVLDLGETSTRDEIKKVISWMKTDKNWITKSISAAEKIIIQLGNKLNRTHHFHRGSVFMHSIYKQFHRHMKPMKTLNITLDDSRWNPSDIWITDKQKIPATQDLVSLNKTLMDGFRKTEIIGISLKDMGSSVNWSIYNIGADKRLFKFKHVEYNPVIFGERGVRILTASGMKLHFYTRTFGRDIECVLEGPHADGGVCKWGDIKHVIDAFSTESLQTYKQVKAEWFGSQTFVISPGGGGTSIMGRLKGFKQISEYWGRCFGGKPTDVQLTREWDRIKPPRSGAGMGRNLLTGDAFAKMDFLISKLQSLQVASIIKNHKDRDAIVTAIYGYSHSLDISDLFEASIYAEMS